MARKEWLKFCDDRNRYRKKRFYPEVAMNDKGKWQETGRMLKCIAPTLFVPCHYMLKRQV